VKTEFGGYALGPALEGDGADAGTVTRDGSNNCSFILGVARDFKEKDESGGHPDFEHYSGDDVTPTLVESALGADMKPVYGGICDSAMTGTCPYGQQFTSKTYFDQWYRYTPNVNKPYLLYLVFAPNGSVMTFESLFYFPLDHAGWGDSGTGTDNARHNFGFTSEIHTEFKYNGGEAFTFRGDDDVWVFMNHRLAMDLGGLHPTASNRIDLDQRAAELGLQKGSTYPLDLFHAERHTAASTFRIDTNLAFTNCGSIPADTPK